MGTGRGEGSLEYARRKSDLAVSKLEEKIAKDKMKKRLAIGDFNRKLEKEDRIKDKLKDHYGSDTLYETLKKQDKIPTTVSEARAQGWKPTGIMKMSDPPVVGFEKDGKVIWIREKKDFKSLVGKKPRKRPNKKGGFVSKYSKGGGVRTAKYKI